jgi:hypothetical protein
MPNEDKPQEVPVTAKNPFWATVDKHSVPEESGMRTIRGAEISLVVCHPEMQANLWGFVTRPMQRDGVATVAISADVPAKFRGYVAYHEVNCFANLDAGDGHHCSHASESELGMVPAPDRDEYVAMRLKFFRGLIAFYEKIPLPTDEFEKVKSQNFRRNMQESLAIWEQAAKS